MFNKWHNNSNNTVNKLHNKIIIYLKFYKYYLYNVFYIINVFCLNALCDIIIFIYSPLMQCNNTQDKQPMSDVTSKYSANIIMHLNLFLKIYNAL